MATSSHSFGGAAPAGAGAAPARSFPVGGADPFGGHELAAPAPPVSTGAVPADATDTRMLALAIAAAAAAVLALGIGLPDYTQGLAEGLRRLTWFMVAGGLVASVLVGRRLPWLFGVTTGIAAAAGARLLVPTQWLVRESLSRAVSDLSFYVLVVAVGLSVATVVVGLRYRSVREPVTEELLAHVLIGLGVLCAVVPFIPWFDVYDDIAGYGNEVVAVVWIVTGGCAVLGGIWRTAYGRGLAGGAMGTAFVSLAVWHLAVGSLFDIPTLGTLLQMLVLLGGCGVVVAAHLRATEATEATGSAALGASDGSIGSAPGGRSSAPVPVPGPVTSGVAGQATYASVGARVGAFLVDGFISSAIWVLAYALLFGALATNNVGALYGSLIAAFAVGIAYPIFMARRIGSRGQSWGHQLCGVRVVDARTGGTIGGWRAFGRILVRGLAAMPCYLGLLWALWEPQRRGWHDMAVGTVVIDARPSGPGAAPGSTPSAVPTASAPIPAPIPLAVPPPLAAPMVDAPGVNADERTVVRPSLPTILPQSTVRPTVHFVAVFDDGGRVMLDRTVLIGRSPAAGPVDQGVLLVAVDDPTMSVSKTHLAIGSDAGMAWVEDRHSTNGVTVVSGGEQMKLVAGRRIGIALGATVHFGGRSVTIVDAAT
jgi:uncharacterized RDD family membrane protein YckC